MQFSPVVAIPKIGRLQRADAQADDHIGNEPARLTGRGDSVHLVESYCEDCSRSAPMRKLTALLTLATAVGLVSMFSTPVAAQSKDTISIADNDSVYIDGKSFSIVPGKAKGDISSQVKMLDAHDLGPGAIVFRTGDKLWIVNAVPVVRGMSDRYGSDRRDYGSDRYGSDRDTSVSAAQAERDWQDYLRGNRRYGSDRRDYGSDRYGSDPTTQPVYIADPEYV